MNKIRHLLGIILVSLFFITSCATNSYHAQTRFNHDLSRESWMQQVQLNPKAWTTHADVWYFTGEANQTERSANYAAFNHSMTIAAVKVPQFTNVNISGNFQVQLVGLQEQNSVYVLGTNPAVRQVSIKVHNNTLYVTQTKNADNNQGEADGNPVDVRKVIVRIGVHNLRELCIAGDGVVEGRNLMSDNLNITAYNSCMALLSGNMNVTKITQYGSGTVSVIGAYSPNLNVYQHGDGEIDVSGRVGLHNVSNTGNGAVHVIGINSSCLNIRTRGNSFTTLSGYANLKKLSASDNSKVYLYWVNSNGAVISEQGCANVGLAGRATNLNISLTGSSRLQGRYLCADTVYVHTHDKAHANIAASRNIFAAAADASSIYYFGAPHNVSSLKTENGIVLAMQDDSSSPSMPTMQTGAWTTPYGSSRVYK